MSFGMPRSQTPVVSRTLTLFSHPGHFEHAKNLVGYAGLGAGVHDSGLKHQGKGITKAGRKELRWAMVEAASRRILGRCGAQFEVTLTGKRNTKVSKREVSTRMRP